MTGELLTRREAAAALRVSVTTLDRMVTRGDLAVVALGRRRLIPTTEIRAIIAGAARRTGDRRPGTIGVAVDGRLW